MNLYSYEKRSRLRAWRPLPPAAAEAAARARSFRHNGGGGRRDAAAAALLARIVGVGDSLTAGYQADGMLGATGVANPLFPGTTIPPTQEQGYWADVDEQASGLPLSQAIAREFDPAISPLPLIAGPGINNQIVPALPAPVRACRKPGNSCADDGGFNAAGYLLGASKRVRMNPYFDDDSRRCAFPASRCTRPIRPDASRNRTRARRCPAFAACSQQSSTAKAARTGRCCATSPVWVRSLRWSTLQ